jgi:FkbM family methyltransferase
MDVAQNFNNCDLASNGEGHLVTAGAPHWRVALDLGANQGDWALTVAAHNDGCRVHCFEPSPSTAEQCRRNTRRHEAITVHNVGAGDRDGTLAFHDYGAGSVLSSFVAREGSVGMKAERVVEVPVVTLDRWLDAQGVDRVDFLKIDTEGFEMPILRGARGSLGSGRIGCVQFEYGGTWLDAGESLRNAAELFQSAGWSLFRLLPDALEAVTYDHRAHENFKYTNYVAAPHRGVLDAWGLQVR